MRTAADIGLVCNHVAERLGAEPITEHNLGDAAMLLMIAARDLEPIVQCSLTSEDMIREKRLAGAALDALQERISQVRGHVGYAPNSVLRREMVAALDDAREVLFLLAREARPVSTTGR